MRKLFLNAGHRGKDTGAIGPINEGAETIVFRDNLCSELKNRGIEAIVDNDTASLTNVINGINTKANAGDISVDIHFNAFNKEAVGSETVVKHGASDVEQELAEQLLLACTATMGTKNRGVKSEKQSQHGKLAMLNKVKCHSVLVEICFCDTQSDCDKYFAHKEELVTAFAEVLEKFCKQ